MAWKYKEEFLEDLGKKDGEPKNHYDIYNYMHWLEDKLSDGENAVNEKDLKEKVNKNEPMPDMHFSLNWECASCGAKYGTQPDYCHGCGCNRFKQIAPEYQSLMG